MKAKETAIVRSLSPSRGHRLAHDRYQSISLQSPPAANSPTFSALMPKAVERSRNEENLAQRRNQKPPQPIQTYTQAHFLGAYNQGHIGPDPTTAPSPEILSPCEEHVHVENGSGPNSSCYRSSGGVRGVREASDCDSAGRQVNEAIQEMYKGWTTMPRLNIRPEFPKRHQSLAQRPIESKTTMERLGLSAPPSPTSLKRYHGHDDAAASQTTDTEPASAGAIFSPLPLYFRGQNFPSTKKGEKTMIGRNGWLECTGSSLDDDRKTHTKRMGFLDSIKKIAKDVVGKLASNRPK